MDPGAAERRAADSLYQRTQKTGMTNECPTQAEENGRGCVMVRQLCGTRARLFVLAVGLMQNPNY